MTGYLLFDWLALAVSITNTILLLWLLEMFGILKLNQ